MFDDSVKKSKMQALNELLGYLADNQAKGLKAKYRPEPVMGEEVAEVEEVEDPELGELASLLGEHESEEPVAKELVEEAAVEAPVAEEAPIEEPVAEEAVALEEGEVPPPVSGDEGEGSKAFLERLKMRRR